MNFQFQVCVNGVRTKYSMEIDKRRFVMGYMTAVGSCGVCGKTFSFNPHKVPSKNNVPFCKECIDSANPIRVEKGLPEIKYSADAYSFTEE